ncbi:hypothetical protein [Agriterribacter sp.]|uniref:hypothetical protein n=1 Tax=Agriterribacter sp. TaxID=2821509 RepID=UPI002C48B47D|nr:hypothetical protein [Agriterribacter sp.]HRO46047.1 hypothetical protein [Agriterribacter sp.]HRQ17083.1 hypothetical protein [Agriterribacter sp.]
MEKMLVSSVIVFFFAMNISCNLHFRENTERINALNEMQQTDADFSNRSKEAGFKKAMLEYIEADGILLRPNSMPVAGADAVEWITSLPDSSFILTWQPRGADMAAAADMGYTYGVYSMAAGDSIRHGTYVTIWKKQADGR